jgi:predicted kinase
MKTFLELVEEQDKISKPIVTAFTRMNPPTTGHLKLIDRVRAIADKEGTAHSVVVSHSQDSKKNPLSGEQKVGHLRRYSPETNFETSSKESPTILHHLAKLHAAGHDHAIVVGGSDRVKEMHDLLHKYNGVQGRHGYFNFKKLEVRSAGHRDPDSEGTEGMSGTKMRQHAQNRDFSSFRQGVPAHVSDEHARELMNDVRKGMGLHENYSRGLYKAIFVTGGPGSGKDVVIRESIAEARAIELNSVQAYNYVADKLKLSEKSNDFRREAIRNRSPLIINCPADDMENISYIKEELDELGYSSLMIFVNTTNESSKTRNEKHSKMMVESVRHDKWTKSQNNKKLYNKIFDQFIEFDNNNTISDLEEDITTAYTTVNQFLDKKIYNDSRIILDENNKIRIKKYNFRAERPDDVPVDNRAVNNNMSDIKYDADKKTKTFTFKTYSESNFNKDKETIKSKKIVPLKNASGAIKTSGVGPEFDTRTQGTVYPMSGMGDVTYREQKQFSNFRNKIKEAIDDPGANDMGVGGGLGGSTNKEPLVTPMDKFATSGITIKKLKKGAK